MRITRSQTEDFMSSFSVEKQFYTVFFQQFGYGCIVELFPFINMYRIGYSPWSKYLLQCFCYITAQFSFSGSTNKYFENTSVQNKTYFHILIMCITIVDVSNTNCPFFVYPRGYYLFLYIKCTWFLLGNIFPSFLINWNIFLLRQMRLDAMDRNTFYSIFFFCQA